ncbi:MAG TPA: flagellar basal body rod protein FlgB [Syntrophales bacterium]|nr:flagellar basal body rod protein FlgB [Syntrophales bacterium]HQA81880.1 flagellar basal body rod protein FlgB [Syntrophales bacterium]
MDFLFGKTIPMLSSVLSYRSERQKLISGNVTNIDTEGYQPRELSFKNRLLEAMAKDQTVQVVRTHGKHLPMPDPSGNTYKVEASGEKVSLDKEMTNLAENHLMYNVTADILARKFKSISIFLKDVR